MNINQAAVDLVKEFEGFRANAYRDAVGVITIGYGTTAMAGVGIKPAMGMAISKSDAEAYLHAALNKFAAQIAPSIASPINENEFGAFVSLAYNIGPGAFKKSTALREFNAGNKQKAADAILLWDKAGGKVLRGLKRRREAERKLFLTPIVNEKPKSSTGLAPHVKNPVVSIGAMIALAMAGFVAWLADLFDKLPFGG